MILDTTAKKIIFINKTSKDLILKIDTSSPTPSKEGTIYYCGHPDNDGNYIHAVVTLEPFYKKIVLKMETKGTPVEMYCEYQYE